MGPINVIMIEPTKQDLEFKEVFKKWQETKDKKLYDKMWFMVIACCNNLGKRLIKRNGIFGNRASTLEERCMDAAIDSIRLLTDGKHNDIISLSAYCSNWVNYHCMHKQSNKAQDKELQLDAFLEEYDNLYEPVSIEYQDNQEFF